MAQSPGNSEIPDKPILVLTWGNPSRGDDALGPLCHDSLVDCNLNGVEVLTDFQLQIEHCTDLEKRQLVIFVDASIAAPTPFGYCEITAVKDPSYTSHAVSPQSLLDICQTVNSSEVPECWLMEIRGYEFGLGSPLTSNAKNNLELAVRAIKDHIKNKIPE